MNPMRSLSLAQIEQPLDLNGGIQRQGRNADRGTCMPASLTKDGYSQI